LLIAMRRDRGQYSATHHSAKPRVADRQNYPVTITGQQNASQSIGLNGVPNRQIPCYLRPAATIGQFQGIF
jgi:hypothetical protein